MAVAHTTGVTRVSRPGKTGGARRRRFAAPLLLVSAAMLLVVLGPASPRASAGGVDDWVHAWEVVQLVQAQRDLPHPPTGPLIYNLGDSIARESVVSEASWTRRLRAKAKAAGRRADVSAYLVAGHNQTFGMDKAIVSALPPHAEGAPMPIVLIGVGISRFIGPPTPKAAADVKSPPDGRLPELSRWMQHHYNDRRPLSAQRKRELVPRWMDRRWTGFNKYRRSNRRVLARVIKLCQDQGLRPVLYDLPLDLSVVRHGLDKPRSAIRTDCRRLARRYDISYLSLQPAVQMPSKGFWDLHHLVRRGYVRWQARLSDRLVRMLPKQ